MYQIMDSSAPKQQNNKHVTSKHFKALSPKTKSCHHTVTLRGNSALRVSGLVFYWVSLSFLVSLRQLQWSNYLPSLLLSCRAFFSFLITERVIAFCCFLLLCAIDNDTTLSHWKRGYKRCYGNKGYLHFLSRDISFCCSIFYYFKCIIWNTYFPINPKISLFFCLSDWNGVNIWSCCNAEWVRLDLSLAPVNTLASWLIEPWSIPLSYIKINVVSALCYCLIKEIYMDFRHRFSLVRSGWEMAKGRWVSTRTHMCVFVCLFMFGYSGMCVFVSLCHDLMVLWK